MPGLGLGLGMGLGSGSGAPSPLSIMGANLVGWWNADSASKITTTGLGVSSWLDEIGGYNLVQGTDADRPQWSATSFNSRFGGVTFDGASEFLRMASTPASFPISTATSEIWFIGTQDALAADATIRNAINYGSIGTGSRTIRRTTGSGVNRANCTASGGSPSNVNIDFSGRVFARAHFVNGDIGIDVNANVGTTAAPTLATTAANVTMGGSNAATPITFWQGVIHQAFVLDATPSAAQLTALNAYCAARTA